MSGFKIDMMQSILGGGKQGAQPMGGLLGGGAGPTGGSGMVGSSARSRNRTVLRKAFGNSQLSLNMMSPACSISSACSSRSSLTAHKKITPFRAVMSAGDPAGTVNEAASPSLPGVSQISKKVPFRLHFGGVHNNGNALFTGNPKYVYDSSDYVRFKKLQAQNRTYNDKSFGGDQSNASQSALRAVRRS